MSKSAYFWLQALWSFIVSSFVWYFTLKHVSFDFYGNSSDDLAWMIFLAGSAVYIVLTILYMILGYKKVKDWRGWMILVSFLICVAIGFLGSMGAIYGSECINRLIN